jgi:hypothetical protein
MIYFFDINRRPIHSIGIVAASALACGIAIFLLFRSLL